MAWCVMSIGLQEAATKVVTMVSSEEIERSVCKVTLYWLILNDVIAM